MLAILHPFNYFAGWALVLVGFVVGAGIGLFFHREDFWGGYPSFRRRIVRLGPIALVALGMLNILFSIAVPESTGKGGPSILLCIGGIPMPAVCFLTGWKASFRHLFFIPVL